MRNLRQKSAALAAVIGMGAMVVGCGSSTLGNPAASLGATNGVPMSVSCEPNQRAIVRQVVVNGVVGQQVECQSASSVVGTSGSVGAATPMYATSPVAYQPIAYQTGAPAVLPVSYTQPYEPARSVRSVEPATREVAAPSRVSYQRAPERVIVRQPKRSVQKSAIIIGSSAGVGAGVGAAVGGKKGAGIGALLGGGGAALWDQLTRRKQ